MREKRQYRCEISGKCCPFNDDVWDLGAGGDIAHDNCPIGKYEDKSHLQENGVYLINDFCMHAIPRDKEGGEKYNNEPEYIVKLQSEMIERAIKIVDTIKEKHPNAKIRVEVELKEVKKCIL